MSGEKYGSDNAVDNKIIEDVNVVGWSVIMIEATNYLPSFAYTIGLWKSYKQPEIISFGLTVKTLHSILNIAGENIRVGNTFRPGKAYCDFFTNGDTQLIEVDNKNIGDYFGYATWFYDGMQFPAMQLVWTDRNNRFPWDDSYQDEFVYRQPLLDRNAHFKFREEKNLAVFTTRQWIEQNKPILRVVHDNDGDWQFLTGDQMPQDIRVVGLEQMILQDATLNDVFNLDYGETATRTTRDGKWVRGNVSPED